MGTKFSDFMKEIEKEAKENVATDQLLALKDYFKSAAKILKAKLFKENK